MIYCCVFDIFPFSFSVLWYILHAGDRAQMLLFGHVAVYTSRLPRKWYVLLSFKSDLWWRRPCSIVLWIIKIMFLLCGHRTDISVTNCMVNPRNKNVQLWTPCEPQANIYRLQLSSIDYLPFNCFSGYISRSCFL